jgi:hypothetical protein
MDNCQLCVAGAAGESGHDRLEFYVGGPFPGQSIFRCEDCGERWIRHASLVERHGWTRYFMQFAEQRRVPIRTGKGGVAPRVAS